MTEDPIERNEQDAPREKKLDELHSLVEKMDVAMLTSRRPDGHLVSRPMATQSREGPADLWFVTDIQTHKLDEIATDPHVNLAYYHTRSREWVSVAGTATISQDRAKIRELYEPKWKAWFPEQDDERDGGPDDPRIALILVDAHSVTYMKTDKPRPVVLFEVAKAMAKGEAPNVGSVRRLGGDELD